jgi:hypothetical protein
LAALWRTIDDESSATVGPLSVFVDIDVSFRPLGSLGPHAGALRSACLTQADLVALLDVVETECADALRVIGIMGYDAQLAALPDRYVGWGDKNKYMHKKEKDPREKSKLTKKKKKKKKKKHTSSRSSFRSRMETLAYRALKWVSAPDVAYKRAAARAELERRCGSSSSSAPAIFVNGGGTGSLATALADNSLTEVTVGSALVRPHLFAGTCELRGDPALLVALRVTRVPYPVE